MAGSSRFEVLRCVGGLFQVGAFGGLSDGQLLDRFVGRNREFAELAFAALVERHGPMVLRVCRRMLGDPHDAEDAFQATFLVLVRRAASVRKRESLASWLHGVALRVCSAARGAADRRRARERTALDRLGGVDVPDPLCRDEIGPVLHEEIGRLREPFRHAVVLCYLEGRTYDEAARLLGCPVGTIKSRLAAARETLRARLTRRGLAPSAGAFVHMLVAETATGTVSQGLSEATLQGAFGLTTKFAPSAGVVSATIASLTTGALRTMAWAPLKTLSVLSLVVVAVGVGALAQQSAGNDSRFAVAPPIDARSRTGADAQPPREEAPGAPTAERQKDPVTLAPEKALKKPISLNLSNTPFFEAITFLVSRTGLNFALDPRALERVGKDARVSLVAENISLDSALKLLLRPLGLTHSVVDGVVLITASPGEVRVALQYYVGDLVPEAVPGTDELTETRTGMDSLIDLIVTTVAPGTWNLQERPEDRNPNKHEAQELRSGTIVPRPSSQDLIVLHTDEVHQQVRARLRQLRRLTRALGPAQRGAPPTKQTVNEKRPDAEPQAGSPAAKVDDPAPRRTIFVPILRSDDLSISHRTALLLHDMMIKQIEMWTPHKVVARPEEAELILDWSLRPSRERTGPAR
jgi:RNA polymerase sigma factor (sigma-70 family)